jgi:hypothetical protein
MFLPSTVIRDRAAQCHDPEVHNLNLHRSKKLKFIIFLVWSVTLLLYLDSESISFIHSFFISFSFVNSVVLFVLHSFVHRFLSSFSHLFIHEFIRTFNLFFFNQVLHSFIHSFIHSILPFLLHFFVPACVPFISFPHLYYSFALFCFFPCFLLSFLNSFIYSVFCSFSHPFIR